MLIKPKLEYTALLGYEIEISLQNFSIEQRISGIVFGYHFHLSSFSFAMLMISGEG